MRLSDYAFNSTLQIVSKNREAYFKITDQADRIIVWLVGFSIATIALLISTSNTVINIPHNLPQIIVIFASLVIILGILYRTLLYVAQFLENHLLLKFEGFVGSIHGPKLATPRTLKETDTLEDIIKYFRTDFDLDFSNIEINDLNEQQKEVYRLIVYSQYTKLATTFKEDLDNELNRISNVLMYHFGYSKKSVNRFKELKGSSRRIPRLFWFCFYSSHVLFILTVLTFMMGTLLFLVNYIQYQICS
jgi:hypothetical protein